MNATLPGTSEQARSQNSAANLKGGFVMQCLTPGGAICSIRKSIRG